MQLPLESQTSQTSSDLAFLVIVLLICEMGPCVPALCRLRPQGPLSQDAGQPPLTSTEAAGLAQSWSTRVFVVLCSGCPNKAPQSGGCKSQIDQSWYQTAQRYTCQLRKGSSRSWEAVYLCWLSHVFSLVSLP